MEDVVFSNFGVAEKCLEYRIVRLVFPARLEMLFDGHGSLVLKGEGRVF
jgi:hypothetical protein